MDFNTNYELYVLLFINVFGANFITLFAYV